MKILITGGTGFVGGAVSKQLLELGHDLTVIGSSRQCRLPAHDHLNYVSADTTHPGDWQKLVASQDALINLAGRSVFHLWTETYKKAIYDSRILTTKNLVAALPEKTETVLLSTSAAGFYGDGGEEEKKETAGAGSDFLARVCQDWEAEALQAANKGARVVLMRFGVILGQGGGALGTMQLPFKLGLGGPIGNGRQWFPWMHLDDLVSAVVYLLTAEECQGPFNFSAPEPVRQKEFARQLGAAFHRPAFLPTPAFVMRTVLGEFGRSLLQGQKVLPNALTESGFLFTYPDIRSALRDLVREGAR
ncbi:TIGR01777 family oxidoreductase [Desulfobulbus rhabdoformis]|uniref:TIGR01777 family oxidoreductase n=1 Tax=Desulfobulbus rhabdoformis TaxID=34032 RepID=UPI0019648726|nr:TIGR01777 family oxidoreductase [Desulfobulbus rhabdoformis]MBM9615561.1 TIGR01777 family oxidoreductase [Desulfobulbus rhabdoformis]